jgi:glycosyltransferase involved in cell wall biosynthesis
LVILSDEGTGGAQGWVERVQHHLVDRRVVVLRHLLPAALETENVRSWDRRSLLPQLREIGAATVMPNWAWRVYPALSYVRLRGLDLRVIAHCRGINVRDCYLPLERHRVHIDAIFSVSRCGQAELTQRMPHWRDRIHHTPTFVERSSSPPMSRRDGGPIRLLYLGRVEHKDKRAGDLVQLVAALMADDVDFTLTVAGAGGYVPLLRSAFAKLPHGGRVRLAGAVPTAAVPALLGEHDVIVQTSDGEGLSNSLLEAMGHGLTAIATPVGDTARAVEHEANGYLFPVGDTAAAAAVVRRLADDRDLLAAWRERAWRTTERYAWPKVSPILLGAIEQVEAGGDRAAAVRLPRRLGLR